MKSVKKVLVTFLLSTTLLIGGIVPLTAFAYSANVEKKLEKINKNIEKEEYCKSFILLFFCYLYKPRYAYGSTQMAGLSHATTSWHYSGPIPD